MRRLALTALGVGWIPGPAGTWASLATTAALLLAHGPTMGPTSVGVLVALALGCAVTLAFSGREVGADGAGDPGFVVSDEVAGQALALGLAGAVGRGAPWAAVGLAFVFFRAFDIAKPGPVGAAERLRGGLGVLADDLVAGAFAGGIVAGARALGWLGG